MIKFKFFLLTILAFGSSALISQEEMTLEKAISIALENNYGVKIAAKNIEIADNNNSWARAGRGPTVDLNGSFNNNLVNDNNAASFLQGTYYIGSLAASLDANWLVLNGGRVKVQKEQFASLADQQRLLQKSDIHDLLKNVVQQYYEILLQQERLLVLENSLKLSKDRLEYEKVRREFGTSGSYNSIQFENALISDSTNIKSQVQAIDIAKRNLYNSLDLIGMPNYVFAENLSTDLEDIDTTKLKEILSEENYTLKSLEMLASINQLNTKLAESSRKPTLNLNGNLGVSENAFKFFADDPNTGVAFETLFSNRFNGSVNAFLNWNLYDGNNRKTDIQNAKLQEEIDQLGILEAKARLNNQLDILISNYQNQKELLTLADQQISIAQRNLEMTEERFKAGQLTSLDYRNIQIQYLNAAFNKVNAIYNLIIVKSEIDYLVGRFE